jgi:hypothetical protein
VRFVGFGVEIGGLDDVAALRAALLEAADGLRREHEGRGLLVRARLYGRGPSTSCCAPTGRCPSSSTTSATSGVAPPPSSGGSLLRDETRSALDRDEIRLRGDFSSELLAIADELRRDPAQRAALFESVFAPLARGRSRRWVEGLDPAAELELLDDAEGRALDLLEQEGA